MPLFRDADLAVGVVRRMWNGRSNRRRLLRTDLAHVSPAPGATRIAVYVI